MSDTNDSGPIIEGSTNLDLPSYEIAPEDAHWVEEILSQDVADLPGIFKAGEGVRLPETVSIDGLPPRLREAALAELKGVPADRRAEAERAAVLKVLRSHSLEIRSKTGFAPSADPVFHELADITREANDALAEYNRLTERMAQVSGWETVQGPDGKPQAKPIPVMGPAELAAVAARQQELLYRISLLVKDDGSHGPEAQRRLDKALLDSVERRKAMAEELEVRAAAKARADEILREERIEKAAGAIAKHRRPSE